MTDPRRFAAHAPRGVLLDPRFWLENPRLVTAVAASVLVGVALIAVVASARGPLPAASALTIYVLVFWGLAVAARGLARLEIEHGIADTVNYRATGWLRKLVSGEVPRPSLSELEPQLLPTNPTPDIGILRLFQHILQEARDRRSSPGFLLMEPYREEAYGSLFRLQGIQRAALQLGILGTFVGLVLALTRLRPGGGAGPAVEGIGPLIGSLDVAFTTSIAGIAVSVILGFAMMALRGKQEAYFRSMEEGTVSVASLARNAINKDEYLAELSQVQVAIHQLGDRILEQSQQTEAQTGVLHSGVRRLVETKGELDGFLDHLSEEQNTFLGEMREVYELLSPERLARRLDERIEESLDQMLARWQRGIDESVGGLSEVGGTLKALVRGLEASQETLREERGFSQETADRSSATILRLSTSLDRLAQRQVEWLAELQRAVPENLEGALMGAVTRAFDALGKGAPEPAAPTSTQFSAGSAELISVIKTVGEIQHGSLRKVVDELSALRASLERRPARRSLGGAFRAYAVWLSEDWKRTAAHLASFARSSDRRRPRRERVASTSVSGEEI